MIALYLDDVKPAYFYFAREFIENRIYYFDNLDVPYKIFTNLEEYIDSDIEKKVAVVHNNFTHDPARDLFFEVFPRIKESSNLIFIVESEQPTDIITDFIDIENVVFVSPGVFKDAKINNKIIFKPTWFEVPVSLYKQLPNALDILEPYSPKEKFFDALLGADKPYRDFVYDSFHQFNLIDKNIINYHHKGGAGHTENSDFIIEPGTTPSYPRYTTDLKRECSAVHVDYHGVKTHLACIIHTGIYNQTAYSIVTETNASDTFHLFSEKTVKPILAKRLFIIFAGQGCLQSLRNLGFRTFSDIIDESYDEILDPTKRWKLAFDQVRNLCNRDQHEVLAKIKPIVEHNYNLLVNRDWTGEAVDQIISKVKSLTN
jgi:hypothetical protein